jgi:hypothetical protein
MTDLKLYFTFSVRGHALGSRPQSATPTESAGPRMKIYNNLLPASRPAPSLSLSKYTLNASSPPKMSSPSKKQAQKLKSKQTKTISLNNYPDWSFSIFQLISEESLNASGVTFRTRDGPSNLYVAPTNPLLRPSSAPAIRPAAKQRDKASHRESNLHNQEDVSFSGNVTMHPLASTSLDRYRVSSPISTIRPEHPSHLLSAGTPRSASVDVYRPASSYATSQSPRQQLFGPPLVNSSRSESPPLSGKFAASRESETSTFPENQSQHQLLNSPNMTSFPSPPISSNDPIPMSTLTVPTSPEASIRNLSLVQSPSLPQPQRDHGPTLVHSFRSDRAPADLAASDHTKLSISGTFKISFNETGAPCEIKPRLERTSKQVAKLALAKSRVSLKSHSVGLTPWAEQNDLNNDLTAERFAIRCSQSQPDVDSSEETNSSFSKYFFDNDTGREVLPDNVVLPHPIRIHGIVKAHQRAESAPGLRPENTAFRLQKILANTNNNTVVPLSELSPSKPDIGIESESVCKRKILHVTKPRRICTPADLLRDRRPAL